MNMIHRPVLAMILVPINCSDGVHLVLVVLEKFWSVRDQHHECTGLKASISKKYRDEPVLFVKWRSCLHFLLHRLTDVYRPRDKYTPCC